VGCLRKSSAGRFQSITQVKDALVAATSAVSSASGALSAHPTQSSSVERTPSIAVLPFANMGADKENEYFSDGLAEEILNALTQLPGLRVIARTSAFRFRGDQDLRKVGEALQVGLVLEGSVRRAGNRIRVSAQLIQVADESRLWSERYDRELRDVFDIQDEIAQAIVEKLELKLGTPVDESNRGRGDAT
jgi:TolB-like protein